MQVIIQSHASVILPGQWGDALFLRASKRQSYPFSLLQFHKLLRCHVPVWTEAHKRNSPREYAPRQENFNCGWQGDGGSVWTTESSRPHSDKRSHTYCLRLQSFPIKVPPIPLEWISTHSPFASFIYVAITNSSLLRLLVSSVMWPKVVCHSSDVTSNGVPSPKILRPGHPPGSLPRWHPGSHACNQCLPSVGFGLLCGWSTPFSIYRERCTDDKMCDFWLVCCCCFDIFFVGPHWVDSLIGFGNGVENSFLPSPSPEASPGNWEEWLAL